MSNNTPVVLLAFANAPDDHLANLKTESRRVYKTLQPLQEHGRVQVHREESSQIGELYEDLLSHDGRIVVFHYGGHANGESLQLENGAGGGTGLARLLGQQSSLKLVFLNGCATKGHVRHLLDAGVPAVIATSVPVGDTKAQEFSNAFYMALAEGRSISESFDAASAFVESAHGADGNSGVVFTRSGTEWDDEDEDDYDTPVLEWGLYVQDACADDLAQWRLPNAQSDWEVHLNDTDGPVRDADGKPYVLRHNAPSRTVNAQVCANCGTSVTTISDDSLACTICGSDDVQTVAVPTQVANQVLPFSVSEQSARATVAALTDVADAQLHPVYLPYWVIDVATRSTFDAERGVVRDFSADTPKVEWEKLNDKVDVSLESQLIPAGTAPVGRARGDDNWYWDLDDATAPEANWLAASKSVPLKQPLQAAFDITAAKMADELDAEIIDRIGGHQRRNISTDTHYRNLAARTVLLPHWYASVTVEGGKAAFVINGRTGAMRTLALPGTVNETHWGDKTMNKRTYESHAAAKSTTFAASIFAGIGIGLMVGLLLGLAAPSAKSIVGIFISAVGVALAALLGLNDKHFSTAKGLRIGSFGLAVFLAAPAGIYARDHGLFSPSIDKQIKAITTLDFSKEQALNYLAIVNAPANSSNKGDGKQKVMAMALSGKSALFNGEGRIEACDALARGRPYDGESTYEDALRSYSTMGPGWTRLAEQAGAKLQGDDRQRALFIARDAKCGLGEFSAGLEFGAAECTYLKSNVAAEADAPEQVRSLLKQVNSKLTTDAKVEGLALMTRALCPNG